jgi:hypothetical protein
MTPTTLPEALAELALVRAELERWRACVNTKSQEKKQLEADHAIHLNILQLDDDRKNQLITEAIGFITDQCVIAECIEGWNTSKERNWINRALEATTE